MLVIVMGVSGCGKSTIAKQLAKELAIDFFDADDFHPQFNIDKMKNGSPLNDDDRKPWLLNLAEQLLVWKNKNGAVLACSALKECYRQILMSKTDQILWVYLSGNFDTIKKRMEIRSGHFMKAELLKSQFDTLEVPNYGIHIDIQKDVTAIIDEVMNELKN